VNNKKENFNEINEENKNNFEHESFVAFIIDELLPDQLSLNTIEYVQSQKSKFTMQLLSSIAIDENNFLLHDRSSTFFVIKNIAKHIKYQCDNISCIAAIKEEPKQTQIEQDLLSSICRLNSDLDILCSFVKDTDKKFGRFSGRIICDMKSIQILCDIINLKLANSKFEILIITPIIKLVQSICNVDSVRPLKSKKKIKVKKKKFKKKKNSY